LANADLEQQGVEVFIKRIQELNKEKRKEIAASFGKSDKKVTVRSASEVSSQGKQRITKTLREGVSSSLEIDYETSPDMILGIEVKTPGNKIAWNIDDYLESLKSLISEKLDERIKAEGTKHNNEDTDGSDKKESGTDNQ
jgi:F-type H+-transporting ATPase subunit b